MNPSRFAFLHNLIETCPGTGGKDIGGPNALQIVVICPIPTSAMCLLLEDGVWEALGAAQCLAIIDRGGGKKAGRR